jgi:hypothetical protein
MCGETARQPDAKSWSPRQESNLDPTLRRHVHYPLCYGEDASEATGAARSRTNLRFGERSLPAQPGIVNQSQL